MHSTGQPDLPLEDLGNGKFAFKAAGLIVQFTDDKKALDIEFQGQKFNFTKE